MQKKILTAVVAATISLGALAPAANAELPLTLNLGMGLWKNDSSRNLNDTETPWAGLEWAFNDNWAAEVMYADDDARTEDGMGRADIVTWQLGMKYYGGSYIGDAGRIRPYLAFGAGEIDIDYGAADTVETTLNGGLGARWMITQRLGLSGEARMLYSLDEHYKDTLLSIGLNFYLGNVDGNTGAGASDAGGYSTGDEDGDGVTDDMDQCPGTPAGTRVDSVGCPLPVTEVASIKMMVNFGFDSSTVEEKYFSDISELAVFLQRFEDVHVDVEGHTDSSGPDDYNQSLSQRRAQAVVDLLVNEYGIAARRLEAKGYGESQPVADNATKEGRAENRRVMATLEVEYAD
ncbi:OmpA family protein [Halioglobus maricola]|uniref:OmpA family protein n=1 Tax=Halioglobus maricola TaxID=2601894 RepID=A0A5P9NI58_9GAMM|nr:OmpA family protein [Halioglobus maricola]QFU74874.1 OmpA family protein [Halioglobus maricola]